MTTYLMEFFIQVGGLGGEAGRRPVDILRAKFCVNYHRSVEVQHCKNIFTVWSYCISSKD
jgi:hypothetical protein